MSISNTFTALADPNRQKILGLLKKREMSVTEIAAKLTITMPTLSHHLNILKQADLISGRREGQRIIYSLNLSIIEAISEKIVKLLKTN